jgi:hypothetical protein
MAEKYGVFQGQYSDWNCIGYFDDEHSAWKYCKMRNETLDDYDRLYVMPIRKIECDLSQIPDGYFVYHFTFHFKDSLWRLYPDYCRKYDDSIDNRLVDYVSDYSCPMINEKTCPSCRVAHVGVCVKEADMAKARDIAYQVMKEYYLETDGVSDG